VCVCQLLCLEKRRVRSNDDLSNVDTMIESWGWIQGNQSINPYCFVSGFFLFFFIIWGNLCHYITFFFFLLMSCNVIKMWFKKYNIFYIILFCMRWQLWEKFLDVHAKYLSRNRSRLHSEGKFKFFFIIKNIKIIQIFF
jgi:hypothetical protein